MYLYIGLNIIVIFLSVATIIGGYGLVGDFGVRFAQININIFGYIAYVYLPFLLYPLFRFYKNSTLNFRRLELIASFSLSFVALLILQSLIFQKGYFGNSLTLFLKDYIGYFGVWVLDIFFFIFSWLISTQRNIDLLMKQAKHKSLVLFDLIKHICILSAQRIKTLYTTLKTHLLPHIQKLFAKHTQDVLDLQRAKEEQITQAHYDFKDVIVEKGFDEMHKSTQTLQDSAPKLDSQENAQIPGSIQSTSLPQSLTSNPQQPQKLRLEIIESTGQEINLQDFFKNQVAEHKDMLKKLNKHIALTEPVLKEKQPHLFMQDDLQEEEAKTQIDIQETSQTSHTKPIPTPPPRPLNPNVFLQTTPTQNAPIQPTLPKTDSTPHLDSKPESKTLESQETSHFTPHTLEANLTSHATPQTDLIQTLDTSPFTPIIPLSSTQTLQPKEQDFVPQTPSTTFNDTSNTPKSQNLAPTHIEEKNDKHTQNLFSTPTLSSKETLSSQLELDIREIAPKQNNATQWVDSIVKEIPTQTPNIKESTHYTHTRITELTENKDLLDNLEYGRMDKPTNFKLPLISFLNQPLDEQMEFDESEIDRKIENLLAKLKMFRVEGDVVRTYSGPIVTTFEFRPAPNVKVSKILTLEDDLAMALRARSIRIQAPIPGKDVVGIEIPNNTTQTIYLREILESDLFKTSASPLTLALGKDIIGNPFITDLKRAPHLLIAGTTGSGKSVGLNAMILSLLYKNSPDNLKLLMIDPKKVEFSIYTDIPHLIAPIINQPKKAISALNSAVNEMERRLDLMSKALVRDIDTYNRKMADEREEKFPYLVIIIDELADLMMTGGKEVEFALARIAQKGRASGIHIIVATQRPSVDVITGLIKANLPSRISYKVGSKIDSKVILDSFGAESLLGKGDMLFKLSDNRVIRLHAPWSTEEEIEKITEFIKSQQEVIYDKDFMIDEKDELVSHNDKENIEGGDLLTEAKNIILQDKKTSASYLQRRLSIGYNKAANIIEQLEREGFLSAPNTKGVREIIG